MTDLLAKTVVFTVGGLVVGGIHSAVSYISGPGTQPERSQPELCVPYVSIQQDTQLLETLLELDADFRSLDHVAGVRAIQSIDALVGLRVTVNTKGHEALIGDRAQGCVYFRKAKLSIQRFITRAEYTRQPRQVVYIQRRVRTLMGLLEAHLQSIIMATRDMYIHP
jgi:hypothetical protein